MKILNKYEYDPQNDILGKGGFATVYKAYDTMLDMPVALKFFNPGDTVNKYNIINEIKRAIILSHPNIIKYFGVETLVTNNVHGQQQEVQIGVMEYIQEGQIKDFLNHNPLMLTEVGDLLVGILEGLKYLHSQCIIHRDIKPQNILLGRDNQKKLIPKIADFGISKNVDSSNTSSSVLLGTIEYMAPEQFNPEKYGINNKVSYNVDIWAFGITAYYILTGEHMFGARTGDTSPGELINKIVNVENLDEKLSKLQEPFKTLIARCVVPDAKTRTQNIDELIGILKKSNISVHASVTVNVNTQDSNAAAAVAETQILPKIENAKISTPVKKESKSENSYASPLKKNDATPQKKSSGKLKYLFITLFFLIAIGGSAYYYFFIHLVNIAKNKQKEHIEKLLLTEKTVLDDLVIIPGLLDDQAFMMGSTELTPNEAPVLPLGVDSFRIAKHEVTRRLWNLVLNDGRYTDSTTLDLPATNVSWNEVSSFIEKLNQIKNFNKITEGTYRLPTEVEWEFASTQPDWTTNPSFLNTISWNINNSEGKLHNVGMLEPNKYGLYDMYGNAYEWCINDFESYQDKMNRGNFDDRDYTTDEAIKSNSSKVIRGGDFKNDVFFVNNKVRNIEAANKSSENIGFRIVLSKK